MVGLRSVGWKGPAQVASGLAGAGALVASLACAPVYSPSAVNISMHEQEGDLTVGSKAGLHGGQVDASYAMTDRFAVRGMLHALGSPDPADGSPQYYRALGIGAERYWAWGRPMPGRPALGDKALGPRVSVSMMMGPTVGRGRSSITINSSSTSYYNNGWGLRTALQVDASLETPYVAFGGALRPVIYHFRHAEDSDAAGSVDDVMFGEGVLLARVGAGALRAEAQVGLSLPLLFDDHTSVGLPFPYILSLGLVGNFREAYRKPGKAEERR